MPAFTMFEGYNKLTATAQIQHTPSNGGATFSVISAYAQGLPKLSPDTFPQTLVGVPVALTMTGIMNSTQHQVLRPALSKMLIGASIPGVPRKFLTYAQLSFSLGVILKGTISLAGFLNSQQHRIHPVYAARQQSI